MKKNQQKTVHVRTVLRYQSDGSSFTLRVTHQMVTHQYTMGKMERERVSANGLRYDVVMQMAEGLQKEGYIVYTDNFDSSPHTFQGLGQPGIQDCGNRGPN